MIKNLSDGNCCSPRGFQAAGLACRIKDSGAPDMGILLASGEVRVFGSFTRNIVQAAPVRLCKSLLEKGGRPRALVVNSGNANACTGKQGEEDARSMQALAAESLGLSASEILVCSTGIIGQKLPMEKVKVGISSAVAELSAEGGKNFSEAILTTDTCTKSIALELELEAGKIRIGGSCKGSGMIHPDMATMLAFVTTDLTLPETFRTEFLAIVNETFNSITVDGDTSTNDTCLLFAGDGSKLNYAELGLSDAALFRKGLHQVLLGLSRKIVDDGEGATRTVEIVVKNAANRQDAFRVAKTVATSSLVKTAIFGQDPNWGRILAAAGRSGADFDPEGIDIYFGEHPVLLHGEPADTEEDKLQKVAGLKQYTLSLDLKAGSACWTVWTCDLSYDYVKINAEYTT